jgi:hypothetical protein
MKNAPPFLVGPAAIAATGADTLTGARLLPTGHRSGASGAGADCARHDVATVGRNLRRVKAAIRVIFHVRRVRFHGRVES